MGGWLAQWVARQTHNSAIWQNLETWVCAPALPLAFRCGFWQVTLTLAFPPKTECICPCGGEIENGSTRNPLTLEIG